MSVPKGDRGKSKLEVLQASMQVSTTLIRACKNEKYFPKSSRWVLSKRIIDECINAAVCIRKANAIYLGKDTSYSFYEMRHSFQMQAHASYEAILELLTIAKEVHNIRGDRIAYWLGLIINADNLVRQWIYSDKERFEKYCRG